jgi:peptidoglycan/xylan/chitin deacetylase (PgdA/CDA1 family)
MKLEVAITVDVEFTIAGAFADPLHRRPIGTESVDCPIGGRNAGLDFILDTLEMHGLRGVFFVEALNTHYFGDDPMGRIAQRIRARGHDVELHAHPCWTIFAYGDWRDRVTANAPCDSFADLDDAAIESALWHGIKAFDRWSLPPPVAFRAGNLAADLRTYACLERCGIPIASNIGVGVCRPRDDALFLEGGRHWIGGTLEVPVSSYPDIRLPGVTRWKSLTVIGTGAWEARQWLNGAARMGIGPIVVLTHPSEFVLGHDGNGPLRDNAVSRRRLQQLCGFLAQNADVFEVVTFADRAKTWTNGPGTGNPRWHASALARALRVVENRAGEVSRAA